MVVSVALRTKRSGLHLIFRCRYVRKGPLSDPARSSSRYHAEQDRVLADTACWKGLAQHIMYELGRRRTNL
jgi:hypothetical protein